MKKPMIKEIQEEKGYNENDKNCDTMHDFLLLEKDSEMSKIKITEKHDCSENNTKFIRTK